MAAHAWAERGIMLSLLVPFARRVPEDCPSAIADLISACVLNRPDERPTAADVVAVLELN